MQVEEVWKGKTHKGYKVVHPTGPIKKFVNKNKDLEFKRRRAYKYWMALEKRRSVRCTCAMDPVSCFIAHIGAHC